MATICHRPAPTARRATKTTSATGNSRHSAAAFTLIELSIVVFIMAVLMALSIPYFVRSYNAMQLGSTARTFVTACDYARYNAVLRQRPVTMQIDLDRQLYILWQAVNTEASLSETPANLRQIELPRQAALLSAQAGEEVARQRGIVEIKFYPNGTCDPATLVLQGTEKNDALAVVVDPVTARARPQAVRR